MLNLKDVISADPEIINGRTAFKGTRVAVKTLFDHLKEGVSLDEFLDDFPSVTREQAVAILEIAGKIIRSENLDKFL